MTRLTVSRRLAVEWWALALIVSGAAFFLIMAEATQRLDWLAYDKMLSLGRRDPDPRILIVAIDDQALQSVEPWPWSRQNHARLVEQLQRARPQAIAYDVLFMEPRAGDGELGRAMRLGAPVYVPLLLEASGPNGSRLNPVLPVPEIAAGAAGMGHVHLLFDADGRIRRLEPAIGSADKTWPHLMQLISHALEPDGRNAAARVSREPVLLPFSGSPGRYPTIGAAEVLRGEVPDEVLRDRAILVAATAMGVGSRHPVAGDSSNGVRSDIEIQAALLDGLLTKTTIAPASSGLRIALALAAAWLMLLCVRVLQPRPLLLAFVAVPLCLVAASLVALLWGRVWISPVPAILLIAVIYPLWAWRRLTAISMHVMSRLEDLRTEPDVFVPAPALSRGFDPVEQQLGHLDEAVSRLRDMRRFVTDSLEQVPDAVYVTDNDGWVLFMNDQARKLAQEIAPGPEPRSIVSLLAQCRLTSTLGPWGAPAEAGSPAWPPVDDRLQCEVMTPFGRCFDLRHIPRVAADDRQIGWLIRLSDITPIWTAQRQREDVLQFLTHDMRSPQASILAVLADAKPSQIAKGLAGRIEQYARRTLALADGFVQLARAEVAQYRLEQHNLSDLIIEAIDDLQPQIKAKGLIVEEQILAQDCFVECDTALMSRAFLNLLDNAVKYSERHGRIVVRLEVSERAGTREAICSIEDQGIGIEPAHLRRLFERFERGPTRPGARTDGVGLGLSIVHAVVVRHGGRLVCNSRLGAGTTFTIALPVAEADLAPRISH